jgi:hypothetical protein
VNSTAPAMRDRPRLAMVHGEAANLDGQWALDHWDTGRPGVPARRGRGRACFGAISQQWLRDAVKRWSRKRSRARPTAMARADNSSFLAEASARRHQTALSAARYAIEQMQRQGQAVSFSRLPGITHRRLQTTAVVSGWLGRDAPA